MKREKRSGAKKLIAGVLAIALSFGFDAAAVGFALRSQAQGMGKTIEMKSKRFALALAMAIGIASVPCIARSQPAAEPNEVRIVVNRVRNQKGSVICSLWAGANADEFTKIGTELHKISVPIQSGQGVCEFKGLPAGAYAGAVFHDENGNGKFDRRFGYPLEGYGFTNDVNPTVRAPSFDQCKVQYAGKGVLTVPINLIYR